MTPVPRCPWADSLIELQTVDSTNDRLKQLAREGAPEGTAVLAHAQSAGRGRMGRSFLSQPDAGVYLSVLLRPQCAPQQLLALSALCAEAVRRAIFACCGVQAQLKWVNDLVLNGKKICGILTELCVDTRTQSVAYALVGVGINCSGNFPPELADIAGSIFSQSGITVDRRALVQALLAQFYALRQTLAAPQTWLEAYRQNCLTLGQPVRVLLPDGARAAVALDIGAQAQLLVRYESGETAEIRAGEVSVRGLYGYI